MAKTSKTAQSPRKSPGALRDGELDKVHGGGKLLGDDIGIPQSGKDKNVSGLDLGSSR